MTKQKIYQRLPFLTITFTFIVWSIIFIYNVSFIAIDGQRYVNLFDDAMISMRYAWNLSQGHGLVWNTSEYVEGYTNLLMTLLMSLVMVLVDNKRLAVLIVHISGIFFMLGNAYITVQIADSLSFTEPEWHRKWLKFLSFVSVLFYYPLTYWSLMGMETGLLTLLTLLATLVALKYAHHPNKQQLLLISIYLGLAYLTRPDAAIAAVLIFLYLFYETYQLKLPRSYLVFCLAAFSLYVLFIIGQLIFRWHYYGELLPNTYYLKATGMPLLARMRNGIGFIIPFVQTTLVALLLMTVGLIFNNNQQVQRQKLLLVYIAVAYIYYQVWIGGDAFPPYWRIIALPMPLVLILAIQGIIYLTEFIPQTSIFKRYFPQIIAKPKYHGLIVLIFTFAVLGAINIGFWPELALTKRPYEAKSNEYHINTAIALNTLTMEDATIGVSSAGTVPYYSDHYAIDFLGKSDKYIARLPPDLSGSAHYQGMLSLPGHNKYDLNYSIKTLQPTYIQIAGWGNQILDDWAKERYVTVNYQGIRLYLLKNSEAVLWEKIKLK